MTLHINSGGALVHGEAGRFSLVCPHCAVHSHLSPVSVPSWGALETARPHHIGIVFRCDACNAPVFLRFQVRSYGPTRVELASDFEPLERQKEVIDPTFLPPRIRTLVDEALTVYSAGCWNAFALMCRRIAHDLVLDLGEHGRLRLFDLLNDSREMGELDAVTFAVIRRVLLGHEQGASASLPPLDADVGPLLLAILKDLLHQCYVRRGRLQQAVGARRAIAVTAPPANVMVLPLTKA